MENWPGIPLMYHHHHHHPRSVWWHVVTFSRLKHDDCWVRVPRWCPPFKGLFNQAAPMAGFQLSDDAGWSQPDESTTLASPSSYCGLVWNNFWNHRKSHSGRKTKGSNSCNAMVFFGLLLTPPALLLGYDAPMPRFERGAPVLPTLLSQGSPNIHDLLNGVQISGFRSWRVLLA